ncbi:MAG: AAA family ATPase [Palaeococcus sp.]|uniref:(d)CMP kinase n=1 Tax=Palaeococcus sp. (in: euryarchaeotes) TaxID=2820298 RepID=UPI0025FEDC9A|nr:AAA family ATPase [Palaeococcus sp. (in: euryarchaeotes)]MCD6559737.1 AAA family ATPase [Palaeococcus sp. (in: euryarchaeotes)]
MKMKRLVITVSGLAGSGTTTLCRNLAGYYGFKHVYAGLIFRQMAEEMGMSLPEFQEYAELHPEVDREVDRRQVEAAKEGNVIIEGRLAGWMVKEADLKIWLDAPLRVRVERVARREKKPYDIAFMETVEREKQNKKRYLNLYSIDIDDLSIYNLVIDTSKWYPDGVFEIVKAAIDHLVLDGDAGTGKKKEVE